MVWPQPCDPAYRAGELASEPRARCRFSVERAHERPEGEEFHCVNRRFADFPDNAPGGVRAFDLREGLDAA